MKIVIYDPPLCCSTGVCGPAVDPELARFAADCDWLKSQGIELARYNLAQQPQAFVDSSEVRNLLETEGNECLPLVFVAGKIFSRGRYPTRAALAEATGLKLEKSIYSEQVRELVAIGAAIAANCEVCLKHHFNLAKKLGVSDRDIIEAVGTALAVKDSPAKAISGLAEKLLRRDSGKKGDPADGAPTSSRAESTRDGCC